MSTNANTSRLAIPMLGQQDRHLMVWLADGSRSWELPDYFGCITDPAERTRKLVGLNCLTLLQRIPAPYGKLWGLGTSGDDVMVGGDFAVSLSAGDGDDVLTTGAGDDYLAGDGDRDWLCAGDGNDELNGGAGQDHLFGEAGDDRLNGGRGDDLLFGGTGNDRLDGDAGNDKLKGGAGDDVYLFGKGDGHDVIFNDDAPGEDLVQFRNGISRDQLWFRRLGKSLEVRLLETGDTLLLKGWFECGVHQVDGFRLSDDGYEPNCHSLARDKVGALVQAMAGFEVPAVGSTALPVAYQDRLNAVLAASWT